MSEALRKAAQAVIDRWDSPDWKDEKHTGDYINALRAALAEPEQSEPVAKVRVHTTGGNAGIAWSAAPLNDYDSLPLMKDGALLFAHPPRREPLTTPDILKLTPQSLQHITDGVLIGFARAIEAAHGITGKSK